MLRTYIPSIRIEIIPDTGHRPHIDKAERMSTLLEDLVVSLPAACIRKAVAPIAGSRRSDCQADRGRLLAFS